MGKCSSQITVDGILTESAWRSADRTEPFVSMFDGGKVQKTRARMLYDKNYLYIAFECEDDYVWSMNASRDSELWEEEAVEVYLDPQGNGRNYYELIVSPLNVQTDLQIPYAGAQSKYKECAKWDCKDLLTGVHVSGQINPDSEVNGGWAVEMAIPYSSLSPSGNVPPRKGDKWRVQMIRFDRPRGHSRPTCTSWSPSRGDFHVPEKFGWVKFD